MKIEDNITLHLGDCLDVLPTLPDESVDAIITDVPYGTTACKWDVVIPLDKMWKQSKRVLKPRGAFVTTSSQPFTSVMIMSNLQWFKYEWIWQKAVGSNFSVLKYQPMREHESALVFSDGTHNYYPIKEKRKGIGLERLKYRHGASLTGEAHGSLVFGGYEVGEYDELRNPSSVQFFNNRERGRGLHPTQKPVALYEYLIRTYTNEGDTVLDFCMGSGTTGVASLKLGRKFIGIEKELKYFEIAKNRIEEAKRMEPA